MEGVQAGLLPTDGVLSPAEAGRRWRSRLADRRLPLWAVPVVERLMRAAVASGMDPQLLVEQWDVFAGEWAEATRVLYAKALLQAGVGVPRGATPEPAPVAGTFRDLIECPQRAPDRTVRTCAWLQVAEGWPAPLPAWVDLKAEEVVVRGADVVVQPAGLRATVVEGAAGVWRRWLQVRGGGGSGPALCTLQSARAAPAGGPVSPRTLQDAFAVRRDAVRSLLSEQLEGAAGDVQLVEHFRRRLDRVPEGLTFDTFRRARMAVLEVLPDMGDGVRGEVRAHRQHRTQESGTS